MQCASVHPHPSLSYQHQDSIQTLAEGLEEYYAANIGVVSRPRDLPPESFSLFRSHDLCHVIFGLGTTLDDEGMADVRTLLSCDVGWRKYSVYMTTDKQAKAIFKELGYWKAILTVLRILPRIGRALRERARMAKPWPWMPPEHYLRRSLYELRQEFRICVI